jgi:hypothetical protein
MGFEQVAVFHLREGARMFWFEVRSIGRGMPFVVGSVENNLAQRLSRYRATGEGDRQVSVQFVRHDQLLAGQLDLADIERVTPLFTEDNSAGEDPSFLPYRINGPDWLS